jgi:glucosamine--fructose-6-phosphate aminotransferase (isomerizing)
MCGIVGYIGDGDATEIILNGLKKLEYRGYDSAGLAVLGSNEIQVRREAGKLQNLEEIIKKNPIEGSIGIGHTRWATHGVPSARNAHPHVGSAGKVVVVHNGIVENYLELKAELQAEGVEFQSETDTETIVQMIERHHTSGCDLITSVMRTVAVLKGAHGLVVMALDEPDKIIAVRIGNAGGVVIGYGDGEMFIASDVPALIEHTRRVSFLESHQMAVVRKSGVEFTDLRGRKLTLPVSQIAWDPVAAEKGEYRHFMQKEIHEQVRSLTDTVAGRVDLEKGIITLNQLNTDPEEIAKIRKITITACGTASHVGMVGKVMIERIARIPVEVDIASEFRYRDPILEPGSLVLAISQSGETADTLAAMEEARRKGAKVWSIVNAIGSQAMRLSDGFISMQCGPEIGVASTKAFTAPLVDLYMLAILLADCRGVINDAERKKLVRDISVIPDLVGKCLDREHEVEKVARALKDTRSALYLGRGINMPIAYEGALKLKEISYIHAEAYPAGEMKHGPIALVDKHLPVVAIIPRDPWHDKMISQVEQVKARGGVVVAVATEGDETTEALADFVLEIPETPWLLSPVTTVIPLQMLAYHIATLRGLDVDQPRNLAKSVTVE